MFKSISHVSSLTMNERNRSVTSTENILEHSIAVGDIEGTKRITKLLNRPLSEKEISLLMFNLHC